MCPHEEKLTAWILGDLSPEEHQALTCHLETCASCRSVRDELSCVLTPLRSGLEKDRQLRIAPQPAKAPPRSTFRTLWSTPHEGLRRAAILTLSFGTLFTIISLVYQGSQRKPHDPNAVTHITFLRDDGKPAPALAPLADLKSEASKDALTESARRSEEFSVDPAPVAMPATPSPEPHAPAFRRLVKADAASEAIRKDSADAAPAAAAAAAPELHAPARPLAKRERSKAAGTVSQRPPADLMTKSVRLAGALAALAPTNAVPTNAVPTNAVAPSLRQNP